MDEMMKVFTFDFGNVNSSEFGIYASSHDTILPPRRKSRQTIPRRHGSFNYANHRPNMFNDRTISLRCFWGIGELGQKTRGDIREIAHWLSRENAQLRLDVEPDKHYIGSLYSDADLLANYHRALEDNRSLNGSFTLEFDCDPFAYSDLKMMEITDGINDVDYRGTAETPTRITIRNPNNFPITGITLTAIKHSQ